MSGLPTNISRRALVAACGLGFATLSLPSMARAMSVPSSSVLGDATVTETSTGYKIYFPDSGASSEVVYTDSGFDLLVSNEMYMRVEKTEANEFFINGELASWESSAVQPRSVPSGFSYVTTIYSGQIQGYAALVGVLVGIIMYNPALGITIANEISDFVQNAPVYLATDYYKNYSTNQNYIVMKFYRDQYVSLIKSYEYGPYS